ncbi:hypothetical protein [Desulfopila aestuarii]|uniref:Uncharacterized protein n=1 Tax=Desulfopila aestuarii DSM 18488 TaxID=1121416 RepID=A0A1M7Y990_9BACT|nr:hypothetical protein [Desulfopila aestuarii]SHO49203.1 hypothetical protein SAMN02745220_02731 [Desulfopila aestuarii DSM 18488]
MDDFTSQCCSLIKKVDEILKYNSEWVQRYGGYAKQILLNEDDLKYKKTNFNEWAPLYLYMTIGEAKGNLLFSLRYVGQDVAKLKVDGQGVTIATNSFTERNMRDFGCNIHLSNHSWSSKEASDFRKHFSNKPIRLDVSKKNDEHRVESLLLTEFSKSDSKDKMICNIQPVKFSGIARFQMKTPLTSSNISNICYEKKAGSGGGIDIISRIGIGRGTKLCVMEVKDENVAAEPPRNAVLQGLSYGVFVLNLLRSESGDLWWKIFGFKGKLPDSLELYIVCTMPSSEVNDISFAEKVINYKQDFFHLHYLYFQEENQCIKKIETSLKQCKKKELLNDN